MFCYLRFSIVAANIVWLVLFFAVVSQGSAQDGESVDDGDKSVFAALRIEIDRVLYSTAADLPIVQRVAIARGIERQIKKMGSLADEDVSESLLGLAEYLWQNRAHDQALRLYGEVGRANSKNLNGSKAYMMMGWIEYGNRTNAAGAVEPYRKAIEILENLPAGERGGAGDDIIGRTRVSLGDVLMILGRDDEAVEQYRGFLEDEDALKIADQNEIMNANLEWARILSKKGDLDGAKKRYEILGEAIKGFKVIGPTETGVLMEILDIQGSDMTPDQHMFALEEIWFGDVGDKANLQSLYVINELCLKSFFSKNEEANKKFHDYSNALLKTSNAARENSPKSLMTDSSLRDVYAMVQQTRLMRMERYTQQKKSKAKTLEIEAFIRKYDRFKRPLFSPFIPVKLSKEIAIEIFKLHEKFIDPIIQQVKKSEKKEELESVLDQPGESVSLDELPRSISIISETKFPIVYVAKGKRVIDVEVWYGGKWFAGGKKMVSDGEDVIEIPIVFPDSAESDSTYIIKAQMRPLNKDGKAEICSVERKNMSLIVERVAFEEFNTSFPPQREYAFDIKYEAADERDIVIEIWKDARFIGGKTQKVEGGIGKTSIGFVVGNIPDEGHGYSVKLSIRPIDSDEKENIVLVEQKNVIVEH